MSTKKPSARLISAFAYPAETIYCLWQASRTRDPIPPAQQVSDWCQRDPAMAAKVAEVFETVIESEIPVAENLDFVFLLENMPVSLREQIVRHRIGHRFGENFGVDLVPGDVQDSWWSQSMRVMDMGQFASNGDYFTPEIPDVECKNEVDGTVVGTAQAIYDNFMRLSERTYQLLIQAGLPPEDARQVIPLAATSRMTWKMNYQSLKHIMKRRSCWIAQLGMWEPIVRDMVEELCKWIGEPMRRLINPPCIRHDHFVECPFIPDNLQRAKGNDPEPPCPLFLQHYGQMVHEIPIDQRKYHRAGRTWDTTAARDRQRFKDMQEAYRLLWNRNVWSGERLS